MRSSDVYTKMALKLSWALRGGIKYDENRPICNGIAVKSASLYSQDDDDVTENLSQKSNITGNFLKMNMHCMMLCTLYIIFGTTTMGLAADDSTYFIYGSPGDSRVAGLYGGKFKFDESGNKSDLKQTKINSAEYKNSFLRGFGVNGLSYDPISNKTLIHLTNNIQHSLVKADPCENNRIKQEDFYFHGRNKLYTGPFALYDSNIYFIAQESRVEDRSVILTLTIRKVTGCYKEDGTFMNMDGFDKRQCSVQVAKLTEKSIFKHDEELLSSQIEYVKRNVKIVGSTLLVIKHENELYFLVQIANPLYDGDKPESYSLDLYEVKEGGEGKLRHSTSLPVKWTRFIIENLGKLSYKDGLLCWTAFESMFCEKWLQSENTLHQISAPASTVCITTSRHKDYQNIVTGIAIVSARDQIQILFGCWASMVKSGGAGYLTANSDWSNTKIEPIIDRKGAILAGSLAVIKECPEPPVMTTTPADGHTSEATTMNTSIAIVVTLMVTWHGL